jgi:phage gpG-like protein
MPLSDMDAIKLYADGFTREELLEFTRAKTVDGKPQYINIDTEGWQHTRQKRRELVETLRHDYIKTQKKKTGRKPTERSITEYTHKRIADFRRKLSKKYGDDTAFVFLREEYGRSFGGKTDYQKARQARSDAKKKKDDAQAYERGRYKD